jgi:hypothetical protein
MMRADNEKVKMYQRVIFTSVLRQNLAPIFQDISDPFHGMEKLGFKIFIDLTSKVRNMDIDDVGRCIEMIVEDLFRDHGPGNDLSRMSHEEFKKDILFRGEFNLCFFPINPMSVRLQNEIGDL